MKKILYACVATVMMGAMFTSCSSTDSAMSSFSKRKYLKNFKPTKYKEKAVSSEEFAAVNKKISTVNVEATKGSIVEAKREGVQPIVLARKAEKQAVKNVKKEIKNWSLYNREVVGNYLAANNNVEMQNTSLSSNRVEQWVLAVLAIFIPPLAVYLYEDSFTGNFWLDLVLCLLFWLPGIIYAFLVIFADVSIA